MVLQLMKPNDEVKKLKIELGEASFFLYYKHFAVYHAKSLFWKFGTITLHRIQHVFDYLKPL